MPRGVRDSSLQGRPGLDSPLPLPPTSLACRSMPTDHPTGLSTHFLMCRAALTTPAPQSLGPLLASAGQHCRKQLWPWASAPATLCAWGGHANIRQHTSTHPNSSRFKSLYFLSLGLQQAEGGRDQFKLSKRKPKFLLALKSLSYRPLP